ncbi:unnamed protein product, partial [marine sediment metagenome]
MFLGGLLEAVAVDVAEGHDPNVRMAADLAEVACAHPAHADRGVPQRPPGRTTGARAQECA